MFVNRGEKNELKFVESLNDKKVKELNPMLLELILDLFGKINDEDTITCIKNKYPTKTDIFIKINNIQKRISIKMGHHNSVHIERISEFIHFLIDNNINKDIIEKYLRFHYADGTTNGKGDTRISSEEYKKYHQNEIDEINKAFNNETLIRKAITRFVTKGRNSKYEVHAIICGTPNDFVWIKREDIYKMILKKCNDYSTGIHLGSLFCQPQNRCLNYNTKYDKKRFCVQIKWYSLYDDIIENMNENIFEQ